MRASGRPATLTLDSYLAITSTYRPPFFLPLAPVPLRGNAAPRRSSILLALLMLVAGLLGGAEGGPPATLLALEAVRFIDGGMADGPERFGDEAALTGGVGLSGGAELEGPGGGGVPVPGGRGVPRGGGGVADLGALSSAPAALLTQRFWSGS